MGYRVGYLEHSDGVFWKGFFLFSLLPLLYSPVSIFGKRECHIVNSQLTGRILHAVFINQKFSDIGRRE